MSELREGAAGNSLRSVLSTLTLLMFHLYITVILGEHDVQWAAISYRIRCLDLNLYIFFYISKGTGDGNLTEAEALLKPYTKRFPNVGSFFYFLFFLLILINYNCILMPHSVKRYYIVLYCVYFVHRVPSCSSTMQELLCSKETSHL